MLAKYSTLNIITSGLVLILSITRTLLLTKYLGPADYGVLALFILLIEYGSYFHLGLNYEIDQILPGLYSNKEESSRYLGQITAKLFLRNFCGLIIIFLVSYVYYDESLYSSFLVGMNVFVLLTMNCLMSISRSIQEYTVYIRSQVLFPLLALIGILPVLYNINLSPEEVLIVLFLSRLLVSIFLTHSISKNIEIFKLQYLFKGVSNMSSRLSYSLFLFNVMIFLYSSWDRYFAEHILDNEDFGAYMFAIFSITVLRNPISAINSIVYPELIRKYRLGNSFKTLFYRVLIIELLLSILFVILGYVFIEGIISAFFEEYLGSASYIRLLLLGFPGFVMISCINMLLIVLGKQLELLKMMVKSVFLLAISALAFVHFSDNINLGYLNLISLVILLLCSTAVLKRNYAF